MRLALALLVSSLAFGEALPLVSKVEFQPLAAQVTRVLTALELVGEPLPARLSRRNSQNHRRRFGRLQRNRPAAGTARSILPRGVNINPESRVKVQQGPAAATLVEQGWRAFLIKVHNEAGVTAVLAADSPNLGQLANSPANLVGRKWLDLGDV